MTDTPENICAGPDSEHGWLHAHASSVLVQDGGVQYTRSDLCVAPSEAEALRAENMALREACIEFVRKCDAGEARSVRSYSQMKAALAANPNRTVQENALREKQEPVVQEAYERGVRDALDRLSEYSSAVKIERGSAFADTLNGAYDLIHALLDQKQEADG